MGSSGSTTDRGPPDGLGLRSSHTENGVELALSGELDLSQAAMVKEAVGRALERFGSAGDTPTRLTVDLQRLSFIDSSGIHALVSAKRRCTQHGTEFSLRLGDSPVRRMLSLAGVAGFLGPCD